MFVKIVLTTKQENYQNFLAEIFGFYAYCKSLRTCRIFWE